MHLKVFATALLLWLAGNSIAEAQTSGVTLKAIGVATLGSDVSSTGLFGAGITIEPAEHVQLFAEATLEVGHSYPADTVGPASNSPYIGQPVFVVISTTPLGIPSRVNATYFGGLRVITPPDRVLRTFVDAGIGLARFKGTTTSYPDNLPVGYYTDSVSIWGAGGGLSKTLGERWVIDGEYRWCHPWSATGGAPFHRLQVGLGFTF